MAPANLGLGRAECEAENCNEEKEGHVCEESLSYRCKCVNCKGSLSLTRPCKCEAAAARLKVVDLRKVALNGGFSL